MIQKYFKDKDENSALPTEFSDPFANDSINKVVFEFNKTKSFFRDDKFHEARIYFTKGTTSGSQKFFDDDPDLLKKRVDNFINNLNS